eukprot:jgi/Mesen1/9615/ME000659S08991
MNLIGSKQQQLRRIMSASQLQSDSTSGSVNAPFSVGGAGSSLSWNAKTGVNGKSSKPDPGLSRNPPFFFPPHRTQLPPRYSYGSSPNLASRWAPSGRKPWVLACLLLLFPLLLFLGTAMWFSRSSLGSDDRTHRKAGSADPTNGASRTEGSKGLGLGSGFKDAEARFMAIIDAGSSGTRLHVFKYTVTETLPAVSPNPASLKIRPGLSSYADKPHAAGTSLQPLIAFAREHIPADLWATTPIKLMATAGLRRVEERAAEEILDSCRAALRGSGFLFKHPEGAAIIPGLWEGLYAWVAANYALNALGTNPQATTGIIELGGASAQGESCGLFFLFPEIPSLAPGSAKFSPKSKVVNSAVISNPCQPAGFEGRISGTGPAEIALDVVGTGNYTRCRQMAARLLAQNREACEHVRCAIGDAFTPALRGTFLATENFFYTSEPPLPSPFPLTLPQARAHARLTPVHTTQFLKLPPLATLHEVEAAGQAFCGATWHGLVEEHQGDQGGELEKYCFSAAYIVALLHDALGIAMRDTSVRFSNKVNEVPVDWALGALIAEISDSIKLEIEALSESRIGGDVSVAILMLAIFGFVMIGCWSCQRYKKSTPKTIYDLEKGRYVITSSSRFSR